MGHSVMANVGARAVTDRLETLLRCGTCAGQSDQELLDRFTASQDEAGLRLSHSRGVLKAMMLKKLTLAACALLPLGIIVLGGSAFVVQKSRAQDHAQTVAASRQDTRPAATTDAPTSAEVDPLIQQLLEAAQASRSPACLLRRRPDHDRPLHRRLS